MGILDRMFLAKHRQRRAQRRHDSVASKTPRACRFELMEERRMLNADPLVIGAVYIEEDLGSDLHGDTFEITFRGGAAGTQLTRLIIDGDQRNDFGNVPGFSAGDVFFDTIEDENSFGADHAFPFTLKYVMSADGTIKTNATVRATVEDGGLQLILDMTNVEAGDRLVFSIDVDEVQDFDPSKPNPPEVNDGIDPVTSGAEFQGTIFTAYFKADHYHDSVVTTTFLNRYDDAFAEANALLKDGELDLPADDERQNRDRTAGAVATTVQAPKPVTISGTVFHDIDQDLVHEAANGEHGIPNVKLSLWQKNANGQYEQVIRNGAPVTATTDANGNYHFGEEWNLLPGYYQIRETQPTDYELSVGAIPGSVAGTSTGSALNSDVLSEIHIPLGDTHAVDFDFAEANPSVLSGYVYHDRDNDGVREPGSNEHGIGGVTISLYDQSGKLVAETVTNEDGYYEFVGLKAGNYKVVQTQPEGWIDGKDAPGTISSGAAPGIATEPDTISNIVLLSGDKAAHYNFGERLGSLMGHVHVDTDGDCVFDPDEQPLAGVTIILEDQNGNTYTTTTDENGRYEFKDLRAGTYTVRQQQPTGYFNGHQKAGSGGGDNSVANVISQVVIGGNNVDLVNYDFCEELGSLSGYVYHDRDNDGVREPGQNEAGIAGVTLRLLDAQGRPVRDANGLEITTTTDSQGFYKFDGLAPGTYTVEEVHPVSWIDGIDTPGVVQSDSGGERPTGQSDGGDRIRQIDLTQAAHEKGSVHGINYNFGERLGSLSGHVYLDADGDCVFDPDETPLAGVTIRLVGSNGQSYTTTTDAQGRYEFTGLAADTYTVIQEQPVDYFNGHQKAGTAGGDASVPNTISQIVLGGDHVNLENYDFCEELGTLSGYVYHDRDNDGQREPNQNEEPIAGVTLRLIGSNGQPVRDAAGRIITAVTDANGFYKFEGVAPGVYTIEQVHPEGWIDGIDTPGTIGSSGSQQRPSGKSDGGDRLLDIDMRQTHDAFGALHGVNYNFGELREASISGRVYTDINGNLTFEPELSFSQPQQRERALGGVTLRLRDSSGNTIATTVTDSEGRYEFRNLPPGTYTVEEVQPTNYFDIGQVAGNLGGNANQPNRITQIVLQSGDVGTDYDFVEAPPATISGYVFRDGEPIFSPDGKAPDNAWELRDGVLTPDDKRLPGVVLELRNGLDGSPIMGDAALPGIYGDGPIRVVTDENGYFEFIGLPRGNYAIYEIQPEDYIDHIDTPGTTLGVAWNAHETAPVAILSRLSNNPPPQYDAILSIPLGYGQVSELNNFSEIQVVGVPYIPETPVPPLNNIPPTITPPMPPIEVAPWAPMPEIPLIPTYGAGGDLAFTWHLSVLDAGRPRGSHESAAFTSDSRWIHTSLIAQNWHVNGLRQGMWTMTAFAQDGPQTFEYLFGLPGAIPLTGDFDGNGTSELAIFYRGEWFIDLNGNGQWDEEDLWAKLGDENDQPVVGDWDGDGKDDIGIFGPMWPGDPNAIAEEPGLPDSKNFLRVKPKNMPPSPDEATSGVRVLQLTESGQPRTDLIDHVFQYGSAGDIGVAGDWNGDGIDNIGVFRNGVWTLDSNGDGRLDRRDVQFRFGEAGDLPLVGDWNGDGIDEVGIYREGRVILDIDGNRRLDATDRVFELSIDGGRPVVGDFDADGIDDVGQYRDLPSSGSSSSSGGAASG